ncbi:globin domain-containing protein [Comamonas odontotermitis]|uniref:globin domain-containing protein n=1 Tax=Comamonas odontotermitis TaxID=379895 RepID=UPI00367087CE
MSPEAIELVRASFAKIKPVASQTGARFYQNLFEIAPELRPLFKADIQDQGQKLMEMFETAVGMLYQPQALKEAIHQLGLRHEAYGILPEHFRPVGLALIRTLEQGLGRELTPPVKHAWIALYAELSTEMERSLREGMEVRRVASVREGLAARRKALPWWRKLFSR